jgi:hypothetical protein
VANRAERDAVADQQVGLRQRERHQSLERAGRAFAQHRDGRDEEHHHEREEPAQRRADGLEHLWASLEERSA